jgi:biopolymer transport protein ExbD/biopolymer transport protein TolR
MGGGGKQGGVKSDINVTPLVDVCLVLLIIFMVVTPMLQRGKDVKLPSAKEPKEKTEKPKSDPLIVSITPDKKVYVEQDEYPADENLQRKLAQVMSDTPEKKNPAQGRHDPLLRRRAEGDEHRPAGARQGHRVGRRGDQGRGSRSPVAGEANAHES